MKETNTHFAFSTNEFRVRNWDSFWSAMDEVRRQQPVEINVGLDNTVSIGGHGKIEDFDFGHDRTLVNVMQDIVDDFETVILTQIGCEEVRHPIAEAYLITADKTDTVDLCSLIKSNVITYGAKIDESELPY